MSDLGRAIRRASDLIGDLSKPVYQGSRALGEVQAQRDQALFLLTEIIRAARLAEEEYHGYNLRIVLDDPATAEEENPSA